MSVRERAKEVSKAFTNLGSEESQLAFLNKLNVEESKLHVTINKFTVTVSKEQRKSIVEFLVKLKQDCIKSNEDVIESHLA